jgi:probable phosphoglycerate mutase
MIFVRHAEAEGNFKRLFQGWTDGGLTEKGYIQANIVAKRLNDFDIDVIYSSSLLRTLETSNCINKYKNIDIIKRDGLKEIHGGDWENMPWDELPIKWPEAYFTWENKPHEHKMPKGESMVEFKDRVVSELEDIVNNTQMKNICIVTHGTVIKVLLTYFKKYKLEELLNVDWCDNTAITVVKKEKSDYNVIIQGDAEHLGSEYSTLLNQKWWTDYKKNKKE